MAASWPVAGMTGPSGSGPREWRAVANAATGSTLRASHYHGHPRSHRGTKGLAARLRGVRGNERWQVRKGQNNGTTVRIRPGQAPGTTWNRSSRFAYCNHAHVRADLHEWYYPRRGFSHVSGRGFEQVRGLAHMEC